MIGVAAIHGCDRPRSHIRERQLARPFPVAAVTVPEQVSPELAVNVTVPSGLYEPMLYVTVTFTGVLPTPRITDSLPVVTVVVVGAGSTCSVTCFVVTP